MFLKASMQSSLLQRRPGMSLAHVYKYLAQKIKTTGHGVSPLKSASGFHTSGKMNNRTITLDNMNPNIIRMQYAVRGPLVIRASEIEKELQKVYISILLYRILQVKMRFFSINMHIKYYFLLIKVFYLS